MAPSHMSLQHTDQALQHAFMGDVASQEGEKQDRASDSEAAKPRHQSSVSEEGLDEGAAGGGHGEEGQGGCCCCMCRRASVIEGECAQWEGATVSLMPFSINVCDILLTRVDSV